MTCHYKIPQSKHDSCLAKIFIKSCIFILRDHPFKTSACRRGGEGGSPLPMSADARGVGVLGLPRSSIFEGMYQDILLKKKYEKPSFA